MSCNKKPSQMTEKEKEEHGIPTKANPHPKIPVGVPHSHNYCADIVLTNDLIPFEKTVRKYTRITR